MIKREKNYSIQNPATIGSLSIHMNIEEGKKKVIIQKATDQPDICFTLILIGGPFRGFFYKFIKFGQLSKLFSCSFIFFFFSSPAATQCFVLHNRL